MSLPQGLLKDVNLYWGELEFHSLILLYEKDPWIKEITPAKKGRRESIYSTLTPLFITLCLTRLLDSVGNYTSLFAYRGSLQI